MAFQSVSDVFVVIVGRALERVGEVLEDTFEAPFDNCSSPDLFRGDSLGVGYVFT